MPEGLKRAIRAVVPRTARNWLRSPSKTAEWLWDSARFYLGRTPTAPLLPDWRVRCHPHAYRVFVRDQIEDPEQGAEFRNFASHCADSMLLFDVGAHYGVFSLAAAHFGGKAVAVDPSPSATRMIVLQASLNGLTDRIRILRAAVSDTSETLALVNAGVFSNGYFQVLRGRAKGDLTEVPALTLDQMAAEYGVPSHVKIDVEGHEGAVLRGGRHVLREHSPILFLELHNEMVASQGGEPCGTLDELGRLGYATFSTCGGPVGRDAILARPIVRIVAGRVK